MSYKVSSWCPSSVQDNLHLEASLCAFKVSKKLRKRKRYEGEILQKTLLKSERENDVTCIALTTPRPVSLQTDFDGEVRQ